MPSSSPTPSIAQLTASMAAGDGAAIEVFYRRYFKLMLSMARSAVPSRRRDEAFTLDVVHDAMLRVVRCIRVVETEPHLLNWTRLVVQSCALDRLRQEQRRTRRELLHAALEPLESTSEITADAAEQIAWLTAKVAALDPTLARMFQLRFAEGWTLTRIAAAFRTTTGQVDGRLRRAIATLRSDARTVFDE